MRAALALLLAACGAVPAPTPSLGLDPSVETFVEAGRNGLVLQARVTVPAEASWTLPDPTVEGVRLVAEPERTERAGEAVVVTRRWALRGPPGSYVVEPLCLTLPGRSDPPPCAPAVYVDLGTRPDRSQMVDIADPPATWPPVPWGALLAVVGGGGVLAGLAMAWRRRPAAVVVTALPEDPPHVAAIRRWEALRDDPTLTPEQKALGLSEIFRTYVEAVLQFPARAWSTTETMAHLEAMPALARPNLPRARRLLRATDRVKYAEARPGGGFFEELEADLHAFVDATRPRALTPREGP